MAASRPPGRILTLIGYYSFILIGWKALVLSSLIRSIEHDFKQTDATFALLYFVSALVYATAALGGGLLTERLGRKAVLVSALVLGGLGAGTQALAPTWLLFVLAVIPSGWGSGVIDGGINGLFLDLYRDARGGALNFLHLFFGVGALVAPFVIGLLVTAGLSWRAIFGITAVAFLLAVPLLARIEVPSGRHDVTAAPGQEADLEKGELSLLPFIGLALGIGLYCAGEIGVSSWVVQLLRSASLPVATGVLSLFWAGLSLGRLLSRWVAERLDYYVFTIACIVLASASLAGAVLSPWLAVAAVLFGLTGMFYGPIFPMIMALGGNIYPHRLARLSGGLTTAAVLGALVYPPLMGLLEARIGLSGGMMGAALLGVPMALSIALARAAAVGARSVGRAGTHAAS